MPHFPFYLLFALCFFFFLIKIQVIKYAFEKIGIPRRSLFLLLLVSLLGSYVNIPIWQISAHHYLMNGAFGLLPSLITTKTTTIAINVGGAVIPVFISFKLMMKVPYAWKTTLATLIVSLIVHHFSRPVPGVGIVVPSLLPPICSALSSLLIEGRATPQTAYIAGSIGTLIGADLANLPQIADLGLDIASIGGAGTFDGIFLSGIMAALLA